jgi:hypothetical protein
MIVVLVDTLLPSLLQGGDAVGEFGLDNRLGAQGGRGRERAATRTGGLRPGHGVSGASAGRPSAW